MRFGELFWRGVIFYNDLSAFIGTLRLYVNFVRHVFSKNRELSFDSNNFLLIVQGLRQSNDEQA